MSRVATGGGRDDPKSLIREGAGCWQSVFAPDGVRFLTAYDYRVRFGRFGRVVDVPLFGYIGSFEAEWKEVAPQEIPTGVKPRREEPRE
jgi:hypothetical protein